MIFNKIFFDSLLNRIDYKTRISNDPVRFIYNYKEKKNRELAGFLASMLAYGRVEIIIAGVSSVLKKIDSAGDSLYDAIMNPAVKFETRLKGFKHRFNNGTDIALVLYSLRNLLKKYGSIENIFLSGITGGDIKIKNILMNFTGIIREEFLTVSKKRRLPLGKTMYLLPSPQDGSPCKRLNLFLRWMIRKDKIDPGVWNEKLGYLTSYLIIPLDAHISKCARKTGMTSRKTNDWRTAEEITGYLKTMEPSDPLKYDFAICHTGMAEIRNSKHS
ncbi:MAG TPA: TIGR02757 family protein [bacterium]|nr:TIGR02757 family protein [bacterium]